jgi:hypothetical protein
MIGKEYFVRQATTLLRMAKVVKDPAVSAKIASKAAELESKIDRIEEPCPGGVQRAEPDTGESGRS